MSRVLVVEDHPPSLRLMLTLLERAGHELVSGARSVDEAWMVLSKGVPDVVLLDVHIPGGGGEGLLRKIRAAPRLANVPVIAVTGLARKGDRDHLLGIGFDAYVSKPIELDRLWATMQRLGNRPA